MDSPEPTQALPVHEFPQGVMLLGDWKNIHLAHLRGYTTRTRPLTQSVVHRMHHLHVSRIRWYKPTPLTFELVSGSHWDAAPPSVGAGPDAVGRAAQITLPAQHQHQYLVAEVSLPIPPAEDATTPGNVTAAVQGYLRIEGTCAPDLAEFRRPASTANANRVTASGHPSRLIIGMNRLGGFGSLDPLPLPNTNLFNADDSTPTRRSTQTSETTPTGLPKRVEQPSPLSARPTELNEETANFQPFAGPSLMEEPDADMDESLDAVPARLDFSYLYRRSNSGSAGSSSPFISPFASRSSSLASGSRGSRGSTDSNRSHGTRSNSRSNSSNATSFSTSSGFSLSSAGLRFSDNPLNSMAGMAGAGVETRFLVSYPGPQFVGFEAQQGPAMTGSGDRENCILELSFPPPTVPSLEVGPQRFLTLRDFTILADLVERSLKSENEDESADPHEDDDTSDSGESDGSGETDPMDIDMPAAPVAPHVTATCCCEYFRRLSDVIPLVSGLRPTPQSLSPLADPMALGDSDQANQGHHELFSHHGRYAMTSSGPESDGRAEETERLRVKFERRRARHEDQLLQIVRPRSFLNTTTDMDPPTVSAYHTSVTVSVAVLNEARLADEQFNRTAEGMRQSTSTSEADTDA